MTLNVAVKSWDLLAWNLALDPALGPELGILGSQDLGPGSPETGPWGFGALGPRTLGNLGALGNLRTLET